MLRQGNVKLIGEEFDELQLNNPGGLAQDGPAGLLRQQIADATARFARIYGFSFEGHYYDLPRPVIMLVHGAGQPVPTPPVNPADPQPPPTIGQSDQAARSWEFSTGLREWNYDKLTYSIRLDLDSGTIEQILLERCLGGAPGAQGAAVSGAGAYGGAAVSGAAVSGAAVSGAGAYGAGAFGRGRRD